MFNQINQEVWLKYLTHDLTTHTYEKHKSYHGDLVMLSCNGFRVLNMKTCKKVKAAYSC